jgi:hypothetical protein
MVEMPENDQLESHKEERVPDMDNRSRKYICLEMSSNFLELNHLN